jgi:hypothetical protein
MNAFADAQRITFRFSHGQLDKRGLPSPVRVLQEVIHVASATGTGRVANIMALTLLDRLLLGRSSASGPCLPGTRLGAENWVPPVARSNRRRADV